VTVSARFYFDLQSPLAYLAAERVLHVLPGPAEWQPVLARELPRATEPASSTATAEADQAWRAEIAERARELRLQPLRWPEPFPFESSRAMRAATYAKSIGRVVPFAQAAFRQAFAGGRNLQEDESILIAAAACEMHPAAVLRGIELRSVASQLAATTRDAAILEIKTVPTIVVDGVLFEGERAIERAAEQMLAAGSALAR
jgi:2-hydroxychromene-2-carboxylate isomerase